MVGRRNRYSMAALKREVLSLKLALNVAIEAKQVVINAHAAAQAQHGETRKEMELLGQKAKMLKRICGNLQKLVDNSRGYIKRVREVDAPDNRRASERRTQSPGQIGAAYVNSELSETNWADIDV